MPSLINLYGEIKEEIKEQYGTDDDRLDDLAYAMGLENTKKINDCMSDFEHFKNSTLEFVSDLAYCLGLEY